MTKYPIETPVEPPIWQGRRGVINTAVVGVLAVVCGLALLFFAQRTVIVPACSAYASAHAMTYTDFTLGGRTIANNVVCQMTRANGHTSSIHLNELVSVVTDQLTSIAVSLEFTIPVFAILFAILRVGWYRKMGN